jgi:hypothetical protein
MGVWRVCFACFQSVHRNNNWLSLGHSGTFGSKYATEYGRRDAKVCRSRSVCHVTPRISAFSQASRFLTLCERPNWARHITQVQAPVGIKLQDEDFLQKRASETYEEFYSRGGWSYDPDIERAFLHHRILLPLALRSGSRILEIGWGTGLHSRLLAELGMQVTGGGRFPTWDCESGS